MEWFSFDCSLQYKYWDLDAKALIIVNCMSVSSMGAAFAEQTKLQVYRRLKEPTTRHTILALLERHKLSSEHARVSRHAGRQWLRTTGSGVRPATD